MRQQLGHLSPLGGKFGFWLVLGLLLPFASEATDFSHYLAFVQGLKVTQRHPDEVTPAWIDGENYYVKDKFGRSYVLRLRSRGVQHSVIAASMFLEGAGLPNAPVFPVLVHKSDTGVSFIPTAQALQSGEWVAATLQPEPRLSDSMAGRMSPYKAGQWIGHTMLAYALGVPIGADSVAFSLSGHVVAKDHEQVFKNFQAEGLTPRKYFDTIPADALNALAVDERTTLVRHLNFIFSCIEQMTDAQMDSVFRSVWQAQNGRNNKSEKAFTGAKVELRRRLRLARVSVADFLVTRGVETAIAESLKVPVTVDPPHFLLPPLSGEKSLPAVASSPTRDLLWRFYFDSTPASRAEALEAWAIELNVAPKEVITTLLTKATGDDRRISHVGPHMRPLRNHPERDNLAQVTLNPLNPQTLFVLSLNDREAREVARIADQSRASVFALDGERYPHGTTLTADLVEEILSTARRRGCTRIVVVEIPGAPEIEAKLWEKNLQIFIVDHHHYKGLERYSPISSLEQSAEILGHKLSPTSRAIGVGDAKFVTGLIDLGIDRESIAPGHQNVRLPPGTTVYQTKKGTFYVYAGNARVQDIITALTVREYPAQVNFLSVGLGSIFFSGESHLTRELMAIAEPHEATFRRAYAGGSPSRTMYYRFLGASSERTNLILRQFVRYMETNEILDEETVAVNALLNICTRRRRN